MVNNKALVQIQGEKFYGISKLLLKLLLGGFAVFMFVLLITAFVYGIEWVPRVLAGYGYSFTNIVLSLSYLAIAVGSLGVPLYFLSLHYLGLARIIKELENLQPETVAK